MKLKVLILHQTLHHTDEVLANYQLYMTEPHIVHTLDEALARLERNHYSLIVVEVTPPWRHAAEPVVVLSATTSIPILALMRGRDAEAFKKCLEVANDCVWEPFVSDEVIARGTALVENSVFDRVPKASIKSIYCNGLLISFEERAVHYLENEIQLARKEYAILKLLAENKNRVLSKEQIYTHVWHGDYAEDVDGVVSYQIYGLRKQLSEHTDIEYIENVWGEGYRFSSKGDKRIRRCV